MKILEDGKTAQGVVQGHGNHCISVWVWACLHLPASRARLRKVGPSTVLCSAAKGGCKINKFKVDSFDSRDEHNWRKLPVSCGGGVAKACE